MEDYIFIIIAILLSVVGAMNRKKKEAAAKGESQPAGRRPSVFDQLFEDPLFAEEVAPVKPQVVEKPVPVPKKKPEPAKKPEPVVQFRPVKKPQVTAPIKDHPPGRRVHPLMKDFSMKKAVIYSEILQRKY
jgi:outer membrane biosynthesis protein TonB